MIGQGGSLVRVAIVIPARYASSRLPGKPLLRATGKYLIQHVYEQACAARCAGDVIVATDDERIRVAVESFGGRVAMTRADHPSGTDRVAEVAASLAADVVINLQGDEPMLDPASLDLLADLLARDPGSDMATLAVPIADRETYLSPNVVKVVCDDRGRALYFSRSPIPMVRDGEPDFTRTGGFLQHLGVYAYRREFLLRIAKTPPHPLELTEKLEQLRVLGAGGTIQVGRVAHGHRGVDTPEDYEAFVRGWQGRKSRAA
jgi:3-deoxy-manno-octulosonate cytidylyltransferase (CMP-KDO synthetase)